MGNFLRRVGRRLLLVANLVVAIAAALLVIIATLRPPVPGLDVEATGLKWPGFAAAVLLLLGNLLWLLRRAPNPNSQYIDSDPASSVFSSGVDCGAARLAGGGGQVRVARDALLLSLRHAGEGVPNVTRVRVCLTQSKDRSVHIRCWFHCPEGAANLAVGELLRQALRERFEAMVRLPKATAVTFELVFAGFHGKLGETPAPVAEVLPFTGPQYPIEPEDEGKGREA